MVCQLHLDDGEEVSLVYARLEVSTSLVHLGFLKRNQFYLTFEVQIMYGFQKFITLKRPPSPP